MTWDSLKEWASDTYRILRRWPHMHEMELGQRFRYCRRLNATICRISAFMAVIAVTRWFHVNNVNGLRYLGYALTCPLMQAELVLLIAPHVWCYRILVVLTCIITFGMLVSGYAASQFPGNLWKTDFADFYEGALEGNFHNLTTKGWCLVPSTVILCFLSFVQIPMLGLVYYCSGGSKNEELPKGYPTLLAITSLTWFGFPVWWFLSYEGASIITDTKWNAVGFVSLNMISKGSYTMQMMRMVKKWKRGQAQNPSRSVGATSKLELPTTPLGRSRQDSEDLAMMRAQSTESRMSRMSRRPSDATLPDFNDFSPEAPALVQRDPRRKPSGQSLQWLVDAMKKWEPQEPTKPTKPTQPVGADLEVETVVITDPLQLNDEQLMEELKKRLVGCRQGPTPRTALNMSIRQACTEILHDEDSEDDE
jgi:bacteriorhodopsin